MPHLFENYNNLRTATRMAVKNNLSYVGAYLIPKSKGAVKSAKGFYYIIIIYINTHYSASVDEV